MKRKKEEDDDEEEEEEEEEEEDGLDDIEDDESGEDDVEDLGACFPSLRKRTRPSLMRGKKKVPSLGPFALV